MNDPRFCDLSGKVVTPQDPDYEEALREGDQAIQKFPKTIVYCYDKYDVANAVLWSKCHHAPFRIRNGGHDHEGDSTGNEVVVIDISSMNNISLHNHLLTVAGGVTSNQLVDFISSKGYHSPDATRCYSLIEVELVNYDGEIILANQDNNQTILADCQESGGSHFGVIVNMVFRLSL